VRLIIIGAEYTGKTTLANNIRGWMKEQMGDPTVMLHDHFLPSIGEGRRGVTPEEEEAEFLRLKPFALEMYMRYMIHYHLGHHFYADNDHLVVNWYYGDAVYAPIYFGYGGPGEYADRHVMARSHDAEVMSLAPDTVLVYLTATPEAIRERMRAAPRPDSRVREEDINIICDRFATEFASTLIRRRVTVDTTNSSPEETLREFLQRMGPHFTYADRTRVISHAALREQPVFGRGTSS
jgi:thymidylate kinase